MKNYQFVGKRPDAFQWEAMQAYLTPVDGIPLMRHVAEDLPHAYGGGKCFVRRVPGDGEPCYVLFEESQNPSIYKEPVLLAVYASYAYQDALPTFQKLVDNGIEALRLDAKSKAFLSSFVVMVVLAAVLVIPVISFVLPFHLGPYSLSFDPLLHAAGAVGIVVAIVAPIGAGIWYLRNQSRQRWITTFAALSAATGA